MKDLLLTSSFAQAMPLPVPYASSPQRYCRKAPELSPGRADLPTR